MWKNPKKMLNVRKKFKKSYAELKSIHPNLSACLLLQKISTPSVKTTIGRYALHYQINKDCECIIKNLVEKKYML